MVKKILYLITVYLFIININNCGKEQYIFEYEKGTLKINNKLINLHDSIEEVLKDLKAQYEEEFMPGYKDYNLINYPMNILVNQTSKKIESVLFEFYNSENNSKEELIDVIIFKDISIKKDVSFNEMEKILNKNNIKYSIDERKEYYNLLIENHSIMSIIYVKKDISRPYTIEINVN